MKNMLRYSYLSCCPPVYNINQEGYASSIRLMYLEINFVYRYIMKR